MDYIAMGLSLDDDDELSTIYATYTNGSFTRNYTFTHTTPSNLMLTGGEWTAPVPSGDYRQLRSLLPQTTSQTVTLWRDSARTQPYNIALLSPP